MGFQLVILTSVDVLLVDVFPQVTNVVEIYQDRIRCKVVIVVNVFNRTEVIKIKEKVIV